MTTTLRETDNRDAAGMIEFLEARVAALVKRVHELEYELKRERRETSSGLVEQ